MGGGTIIRKEVKGLAIGEDLGRFRLLWWMLGRSGSKSWGGGGGDGRGGRRRVGVMRWVGLFLFLREGWLPLSVVVAVVL